VFKLCYEHVVRGHFSSFQFSEYGGFFVYFFSEFFVGKSEFFPSLSNFNRVVFCHFLGYFDFGFGFLFGLESDWGWRYLASERLL
jgi:hypothetical protein